MIDPQKVGVIGAGTMGNGIAQVCAQAGFETVLYDVAQDFVDKGIERIKGFLARSRERGKLAAEEEEKILGRLHGSLSLEALKDACLVIEAAPEKIELKREIFRNLDALCDPAALLASNTSSLSVTAIASAAKIPERVLGMHFFNPPPLMALVEIIQGDRTGDRTMEQATDLTRRMGKTPVRAKDTPGFLVNRIARPFYNEALKILGDGGATVENIDRIMKLAGGFPMGPFELIDLIGNDINFAVTESLYAAFFQDPRFRPSPIQQKMVLAGNLGRKTGRGFYVYDKK
jgi:3-hydroxybutyryl-CoA dehydrogenase